MDLPVMLGLILVFGVVIYVILDGFDLGIGILFAWSGNQRERDLMMASVAPYWDGNETWLVLGGAALFGAFPLAYSILLPALYLPITLLLFALIFRGVAFEYRGKAYRSRRLWTFAFGAGSTLAAFGQGLILGAFIQGFEVTDGQYRGGPFDWLTPFSVMTGAALVVGYALLGATWLIIKTDGALQNRAYRIAEKLLFGVLLFIALVSLWTPLMDPAIRDRWFGWPNLLYLSPAPLLTALNAFLLWRALRQQRERAPFVYGIGLFLLSFLGLGISLWPYVVPRALTLWQASSSPQAQRFLLAGVAVLIPVILTYTAYSYRVFKGKVTAEDGYH